jgi:hypothetical protein
MKKIILLLLLAGAAFAQSDTPNYDHYQFSMSAGSALWTKPFAPKFEGNITFGYKFAQNYTKLFDTVYGTFGYIGENRNEANDYHVGVQRTMMNTEDRIGLLWRVEGGTTAIFAGDHAAFHPAIGTGLGLGLDTSGWPYPKCMWHGLVTIMPMLQKIGDRPLVVTLMAGFTKTF